VVVRRMLTVAVSPGLAFQVAGDRAITALLPGTGVAFATLLALGVGVSELLFAGGVGVAVGWAELAVAGSPR
jgi:hypothetical protein